MTRKSPGDLNTTIHICKDDGSMFRDTIFKRGKDERENEKWK